MRTALLTSVFLLAFHVAAIADNFVVGGEAPFTTISGTAFGTAFHVKFITPSDSQQISTLRSRIDEEINRINSQMSLWDSESELSRFNRSAGSEWFPVSKETVIVVEAGLRIREKTGGTFDPTIRPLLSLWSFGPDQRPHQIPNDEQITTAVKLVGQPIETRMSPSPALRKSSPGVELDLNAIAKGYAVDVVAELVSAVSPQGYMVEIGGEVRTAGTKPDGTLWRIAIEQPVAGLRTVASYLELQDASLATSGDYRNYFEQDGRRYSHTIDPRTGRPITHQLASVSVVAEDCMAADAWATALMVLGPDDGYHLAMEQNIAALFLVREGETFAPRQTPGFPELMALDPAMDANWTTFLIAGAVFAIAVAGMAIGVIFSNRRLRGSCGGLNGLKDSQGNPMCDACTTPPEQCDEFRKQMTSAAKSQEDE